MFDKFIAFIHYFVQPSAAQLEELLAHVTVQHHPKNQLSTKAFCAIFLWMANTTARSGFRLKTTW